MLKRGGKSSYNPYSTSQRVKKAESKGKDRLDILPNKHNIWLKQVCLSMMHVALCSQHKWHVCKDAFQFLSCDWGVLAVSENLSGPKTSRH